MKIKDRKRKEDKKKGKKVIKAKKKHLVKIPA